jgi:hypothetical protein
MRGGFREVRDTFQIKREEYHFITSMVLGESVQQMDSGGTH